MGPGDRFTVTKLPECVFGIGIWFDRFPYNYTIGIHLIKWSIQLGFGKPYTEYDNEEE